MFFEEMKPNEEWMTAVLIVRELQKKTIRLRKPVWMSTAQRRKLSNVPNLLAEKSKAFAEKLCFSADSEKKRMPLH